MTTGSASIQRKILSVISAHRDEIIADLSELVRIPSLVGHEGPIQQHMSKRLKALGMELDTFEADANTLAKHPAYVPLPVDYAGRPNVVGIRHGAGLGRSLILNATSMWFHPSPSRSGHTIPGVPRSKAGNFTALGSRTLSLATKYSWSFHVFLTPVRVLETIGSVRHIIRRPRKQHCQLAKLLIPTGTRDSKFPLNSPTFRVTQKKRRPDIRP
jgi:hypothetical protein